MRLLAIALALAVSLATPAAAQQAALEAALARYTTARTRDPRNPFWSFAVVQTQRRLGREAGPESFPAQGDENWGPRLYELTTGAAAIQEALQLERMLGGGDADAPATVAIDSIPGIDRPSIPFETLLAGRTPVIERAASYAPADWYYTHFTSVPAMRRVLEASDRWGAHLLSSYRLSGRDAHLRERLERRLLLRMAPELDPFYQLVVGEIAVVGSDPFLFEGSDVTVVFSLKAPALFASRMGMARREAAPGNVRVISEHYRGWEIEGIVTADRSVSSFTSVRGEVGLVSTSLSALRRVADTVNGTLPPLAKSDDFRYARSLYPYASEAEDGFLFLSDAFVRQVVGPRQKIAEARRVRCAVSLQTAAFATMLFQGERREAPTSLEELFARGFLDRRALRCPDAGQYALSGGTPECSVHGRIGAMTPNLELPIERVSPQEATAYGEFREAYRNYWRRYVDPVAVRARVGARLEVEATILPLVENSAYRGLLSALGAGPVDLASPRLPSAVLAVDFAFPTPQRRDVSTEDWNTIARALGASVTVQVGDSVPFFSPLAAGGLGLFFGSEMGMIGAAFAALVVPVVVAAPVRDRAALDAALAQFRKEVRDERPSWISVSNYELVEEGARPVEAVMVDIMGGRTRFYFAVVGDRFVVSNRRELIDELAGGQASEPARGSVRLEIIPSRWAQLKPSMEIGYAEDARAACIPNLSWLEALHLANGEPPGDLGDDALRLTGYGFVCPGGGTYAIANGAASCSAHGTALAPRQTPRPLPGSAAAFVLESVGRVSATLTLTPDGLSSRVVIE